jgi:hypothetical protein
MVDNLKCKLCDYTAKQLFQHLRAVHNISTQEYRERFGKDEVVQLNFNPSRSTVDVEHANYVRGGYKKQKTLLQNVKQLYSKDTVRDILIENELWKNYVGRTKQRTLFKDDIVLYKSIFEYTNILNDYINCVKLPQRLVFIIDGNYDINFAKCECGNTYTFNKYCRYCPVNKSNPANRKQSAETKRKRRLSAIKYISKMKGQCAPRYNIDSIPIIEQYGKDHGYNFKHAENGGEYYIKDLGYWVDGYDEVKNVVIEIDERHHFQYGGELKDRDQQRQSEIENKLNCEFIRIKYESK